jgi:hypothetical protein
MPTERELLALCLRWLEHPGLIHPFDKAMLVESLKAKLQPEPRPWVSLTDEEIWGAVSRIGTANSDVNPYMTIVDARAIEKLLKEKNT